MDSLTKELTGVWRKLGRMLTTGVPLLKALRSIIPEVSDDRLRSALVEIVQTVEAGSTFHAAIGRHPAFFPPTVLTLVQVGEMSATLDKSAAAVADGLDDASIVPPASGTPAREKEPGALPGNETRAGADHIATETEARRLATEIICRSIESRATDIHMDITGEKPRIRMRVDGLLTGDGLPAIESKTYPDLVAHVKLMAGMIPAETQKLQDGRITLSLRKAQYDLRVNSTPCASGESVAMRILPRDRKAPLLAELGLPEPVAAGLKSWASRPAGIAVVCGPVDSGKTTTLYSILRELDVSRTKVMSVEDPVECLMDGVDQVQVRPSHGITFAAALRSMLRQDPDAILVGEIRDLETAQVCMQTALTGHLVLTALHTSDASAAVRRLMDIGLAPHLVGDTLIGVLAQRLVRQVCRKCAEEYTPGENLLRIAKAQHPQVSRFVRGRGCEACLRTGYSGRIPIAELLEVNGELQTLIGRNPTADEVRAQAVRSGMRTLQQNAMGRVRDHLTTIEEVDRFCRIG